MESRNPFLGAAGLPARAEKLFPEISPEEVVNISSFLWDQAALHPEKERWYRLASNAVYLLAVARKKLELFEAFAKGES